MAVVFMETSFTNQAVSSISLWLQLRKQNHVTNTFLSQQHHAKPVNADSNSASRRHSVFEGNQKIFIKFLLLATGLMFQRCALGYRVVLLGVGSARAPRAVFRAPRNTQARE
jgi:hypothetical protein